MPLGRPSARARADLSSARGLRRGLERAPWRATTSAKIICSAPGRCQGRASVSILIASISQPDNLFWRRGSGAKSWRARKRAPGIWLAAATWCLLSPGARRNTTARPAALGAGAMASNQSLGRAARPHARSDVSIRRLGPRLRVTSFSTFARAALILAPLG